VGRAAGGRDDAAQEAFIRICRGLPRFEPGGPARLSTWILTVATRSCLNTIRDGRRWAEQPEPPPPGVAPGDPEQTASDRQLGRRVEAAMAALSEDLRAVLVLRAYHDFDYDQIAAAIGVEVGTVKSRLARARAALKDALKNADEEIRSERF
jgi:RNA polymerase sigma-70 factor (ECF subfamily)